MEHGLSCSVHGGSLLTNQGSNLHPLHCKVDSLPLGHLRSPSGFFFSLSTLYSWKAVSVYRNSAPPPWGQRIYINYLKFHCVGDLPILHQFIQIISMKFSIFILYWIIYNPRLFYRSHCFRLGLWELFLAEAVFLGHASIIACCCLLFWALTLWPQKMLQAHPAHPRNSHFSKKSYSLLLENSPKA